MKHGPMAEPDIAELQRHNSSFEYLAAFGAGATSLTGTGEPIRVTGWTVTPEFWPALGVAPALGRTFRLGSDGAVVLLSDKLWRGHFNADPAVLGKAVQLDGAVHTIIGVMPATFNFPSGAALWTPLRVAETAGNNVWLRSVLGRLRPGVEIAQANAEIQAFAHHRKLFPAGAGAGVVGLQEAVAGKVRPALLVLLGAVGFVLLIACANVANLLLARGSGRRQEIAVRTSLGATRIRLIRQLLTESSILALCAGMLGILIASWAVPLLVELVPPGMIPRIGEIRIDVQVLWFTLALSLGTSLLFGIAPAVQMSKSRLAEFLKRGDGRSTSGNGLRNALAIAEIALSLILLIGAGLMIKSFVRLRSVNPGFDPEHVTVLSVNLPSDRPQTVPQLVAYHERALEKWSGLPGVISAGAVNWLPLEGAFIRGDFYAEGKPRSATRFHVSKPGVSPDYFRAMGIALLRGRVFDRRDTADAAGVAVIAQSAAKRVWGLEDPIGKRLTLEDHPKPKDWLTVVGVVDDVKQENLGEKTPVPAVYQPMTQVTRPFFLLHMAYVVRASGDPSMLAGLMRAGFRELDPNQPIQLLSSMDDLIDTTTAEPRFYSRMLGSFSAMALLLATLGIYSVMAYSVAQRTREIGIRVALGAEPADILRSVLKRSIMLALIGVALGLAGAVAATGVLRTLLFEVQPTDIATFTTVSLMLLLVAALASYLPARRATRVDPLVALREE